MCYSSVALSLMINDLDAFMHAGWHGEGTRADLQAHRNSHCSRGNSSESICAQNWFRSNYFAISPTAILLLLSFQPRREMSGELRRMEREVCTP